MIATDIFEALWKQKKLIALFVAVAFLACHLCLCLGQTHTAAVYIKYTEGAAVNGVATNGSALDPYEITDPYIVSQALLQLGQSAGRANTMAQRIQVTPVVSAAEQEKYASWIDGFSDYENTEEQKPAPVYYKITFRSGEGVQFAREFLSALVQQYRTYYAEQYGGFNEVAQISEAVVLNSDYFFAVDLLQTQIEYVREYLRGITATDIDYRSPATGYSLNDLNDAYSLLLELDVAPLMQYILDAGVSKDVATLVADLQQSADKAQLNSEQNTEKATTQKQMMLLYAEKNKEYLSSVVSTEGDDEQVWGDVERDKVYQRTMTTYDQMMLDYVEYSTKSRDLLIDKAYLNSKLGKFGSTDTTVATPEADIAELYAQYAELMEITERTLDGYNAYKSGKVLLQASGIQVLETLPELLYYTVSVILAFCTGCGLVMIWELKKLREKHGAETETAPDGVL